MEKHQPDPGRLYPVVPPCVKDIVERIDAQAAVSYPDSASSRVTMTRELLIEALGEVYTRLEAANKVLDTPSPAAWGMTYMGSLMPTVYVVEGDATKEFKRRNTVYPDSAEHRKMVAVYTVPVEALSCRKCGGAMKPSKAITNTYAVSDEGTVNEAAHVGNAPLIDCMKCEVCGWSATAGGTQ